MRLPWCVIVGVAACGPAAPPSRPEPATAADPRDPIWIGWRMKDPAHPLVRVCGTGGKDPVPHIGAAGCWRGGIGGPVLASDDGFVGDDRPDERVPGGGCTITHRGGAWGATVETALGDRVIDRWHPETHARVDAADTRIAFSPDGKWLAIAHLVRRGYGDGRRWDVEGVQVAPVASPACATAIAATDAE